MLSTVADLVSHGTASLNTSVSEVHGTASLTTSVTEAHGTASLNTSVTEAENLEEAMRKAQEDAEIRQSVVMPLEKEIESLKHELKKLII